MSEESTVEIPENQQDLDVSESDSKESEPGSTDPVLSARAERYGLTPEQAKMLDLYL